MVAKTRNGARPAVGRREVIVMSISIYNKGCSRLALLYDEATKTNDGLMGLKFGCKDRHFMCHGGYNGFNLGIKRVTIRLHGAPVVILSTGQSHAASLQRQRRVAEQVGSRRPMAEVAAGVVIGGTNGHIISVEMKKKHGERKKNEEKDCCIVFSFYIWAFLSKPGVLRNCAL